MQKNRFVIFGDPVEHSKSPQMHNAAFEYLKHDNIYEKYLLKNANKINDVFNKEGFLGANITVPHKETAYLKADEVRGIAQKIQAVNTYIKENDKIIAYNTDGAGFIKAIQVFKNVKKVLILGAGGTAKAIALSLQEKNYDVTVINRSPEKLIFFKENNIRTFTWDNFRLNAYDLVVNATSAGLKNQEYPLPMQKLENVFLNAHYAFDCIYGITTPFLALAKKEKLQVKDGEDMLLYQGVLALEYFLKQTIDTKTIEIMRQALKENNETH